MVRIRPPEPEAIAEAAELLRSGKLVAFPTETVYGLGADATNDVAVAALFRAKGRPAHNPLIVHVAAREAAEPLASFDARARHLAERFWPGPLTLVLRQRSDSPVSPRATAGLDTVAIRVPAHPVALALLRAVGRPVVAPSANRSGRVSPTCAEDVAAELGEAVALVLDAGPCPIGVESTVIDLSDPDRARILRPGGVTRSELEAILGPLAEAPTDEKAPRSPGRMRSHYAPRLPVRLDARTVAADEALLAFGDDVPKGALWTFNLSPSGDLAEAARNLYRALRLADRSGARAIAVVPIPTRGLGEAIRDRLARAAAPRPDETVGLEGA
ncbi:MAG: L-threonylcarbamoyladenylate synthase [Geminicoccaceae bacterium]|nr:L-threonylcarbamoyladenylate synthase [Geminicoccaceae bacterium]MCS7269061.1 L-threonylcarbamoyladenylate synthase [Geminicoccaceae bacterium]MCX7629110.1 L-threonylcarbamoyladenylate synthase [Geminicoccaceae bacterium]MDW8342397.1 L-threonylcarbamoyladenylate synthase [Geminicoccaceae bacterium]